MTATQVGIDYEEVTRGVVGNIGCSSCLDDSVSVVCRCRVDRETKKGVEDAGAQLRVGWRTLQTLRRTSSRVER